MPAWVANLLKVDVQAPIYGLVFAVPSSITRLPSAAALAGATNDSVPNKAASRAITMRMAVPSNGRQVKNGNANPETMPDALRDGIAAMRVHGHAASRRRGHG